MSEESPLSRRQLLAAVGGVGALSTAGASASLGLLGDVERFGATADSGTVELDLDCAADGCVDSPNQLTVPFDGLAPGETGRRQITIGLADGSNPVYLWFRPECPDPRNPLTTALDLRLSLLDADCDPTDDSSLFDTWMGFKELLTELRRRDGIALAGIDCPCLEETDQLTLNVEYRLAPGTEWLAGASVDLEFVFAARQCRHADGSNPPFTGRECPGLQCPDCVELGKAEVARDRLMPGEELSFEETDGYSLRVLTVTDKVENGDNETVCASFALLKDGSEADAPPICEVEVKGSQNTIVAYDNDPPSTRTRGEVCTTTDEIDQSTPAISNVTVYVCSDDTEVTTSG